MPKVRYGAYDTAVDTDRGKVLIGGAFDDVDGQPGTSSFATVDINTGALVPAANAFELNYLFAGQIYQPGVAYAGGNYWTTGAQHSTQMLDPDTHARLGYTSTGLWCESFEQPDDRCGRPNSGGGGDFQVLEVIGDWVFTGCHCFDARLNLDYWAGRGEHYSSFDQAWTDTHYSPAYHATTGLTSEFVPGLSRSQYGTYAIHFDANGCLYVGSDYTRSADGDWLGGFAKMCEPLEAPGSFAASSPGGNKARLTWSESASPLPVVQYKLYRDGSFIGDLNNVDGDLAYTDVGRSAGATHSYTVIAVDAHGRKSPAAANTVTIAAGDATPPSTPQSVVATPAADSVDLTWAAATDNVGVTGYLIHRDYDYLAYVRASAPRAFTDDRVADGATYRYQVRAQDAAGNNSTPSATQTVVVGGGGADNTAPGIPPSVEGSLAGTTANLTWGAATDNVGVTAYLIHRDYQYLAYRSANSPRTFVDPGLNAGQTYRWQVRAQDAAGNVSPPAVRVKLTP